MNRLYFFFFFLIHQAGQIEQFSGPVLARGCLFDTPGFEPFCLDMVRSGVA